MSCWPMERSISTVSRSWAWLMRMKALTQAVWNRSTTSWCSSATAAGAALGSVMLLPVLRVEGLPGDVQHVGAHMSSEGLAVRLERRPPGEVRDGHTKVLGGRAHHNGGDAPAPVGPMGPGEVHCPAIRRVGNKRRSVPVGRPIVAPRRLPELLPLPKDRQ